MTRDEHLEWAKVRALEYLDRSPPNLAGAFASMCSDICKHEELAEHCGIKLGIMLKINGYLDLEHRMRDWIEGFN